MFPDDTIVITGMGVVSPIGTTIETFAESLKQNRSGLTSLNRFDPAPFNSTQSFEISNFKLEGKKSQELLRINKSAQYAISASGEALKQSCYPIEENPFEVGLVLGSSFFDFALVTKYLTDVLKSQLDDYRPLLFPNTVPNAAAAHVAIELKIKGFNVTLINKQNSAFSAIEYGIHSLRTGKAKMVLAGGVDYFAYETFLYFQQLGRVSGIKEQEIHIPFSKERNGFIMGEGCGVVALEKTGDALKRGAKIIAEIHSNSSGYFPCPVDEYLAEGLPDTNMVYNKLLSKANLAKEEVDAFFSCANSSVDIDAWEDRAIFSYFGKDLPVTAFSSFIGEASDASILHIIAACLCLRDNFLFPVLGYSYNPEMKSNILQKNEENVDLSNIIVSRLGLGGSYSTCLLSRSRY